MSAEHPHYREIFEHTPMALLEEDCTPVFELLDSLRKEGQENPFVYLRQHPQVLAGLTTSIRIIDVNQCGLELLEAQDTSQVLTSLSRFFSPDNPTIHELLIGLAEGADKRQYETHLQTLKGRRVEVLLQCQVLPRQNGRVRVLFGLLDISESKQMAQALREMNADLSRSNAELERFAFVASHDLREPLHMISNYVRLFADRFRGKSDSDGDRFIDIILDGIRRMNGLIDGIMELSRVNSRSRTLRPTNLERVLVEVKAQLAFAIEQSGAQITHERLPMVFADDSQMVQLLQNLIANAIKFTKKGVTPRIHISVNKPNSEWHISVKDNGIGIEECHLNSIFEMFKRLHSRGEYPGVGIGLAVAQKIVQHHGGRMWATSVLGEGSTFVIALPAHILASIHDQ